MNNTLKYAICPCKGDTESDIGIEIINDLINTNNFSVWPKFGFEKKIPSDNSSFWKLIVSSERNYTLGADTFQYENVPTLFAPSNGFCGKGAMNSDYLFFSANNLSKYVMIGYYTCEADMDKQIHSILTFSIEKAVDNKDFVLIDALCVNNVAEHKGGGYLLKTLI